jgi:hypothetical protein
MKGGISLKKEYITPELTVYEDLKEITGGTGTGPSVIN